MKTIDKEMSLFGDLYYNATREEVADLAKGMKKYPMNAISSYLKLVMQDVLAHLAGSTSFMDACMVRDKLHFESKINNKIGKRKLVELLSLLEELDKLGIHMDEVEFLPNDNDKFLDAVIKERRKGILQDYLAIRNLNDFFEFVMMVVTLMPMAKRNEEFDAFIPDPTNFDFKSNYYESIDYLLYYMDKDRHESLMNKHISVGREINLIEWIKNYKNRYAIKDILREGMGIGTDGYDKDSVSDDDINADLEEKIMNFAKSEYDFSESELDYLRLAVKDLQKEIFILKNQIAEMRSSAKVILETQDIKLTDEKLEALEDEFVAETVVKHITKKPRKNRTAAILIFSAIIASLVLIPTFDKTSSLKYGENNSFKKEYVAIEEGKDDNTGLDVPEDETLKVPEEDDVVEDHGMISIVIPEEEKVVIPQDDEDIYKTEFILGETVSSNVPFYISATSNEVLGFLNEEVITIGYFATLDGKDGVKILRSCRTQEEMDKFLRLYNGDGSDIIWRAAVTRVSSEKIQEYLASGENIPYELTTCYIDCAPAKELSKIRGK